MNTYDMGGKINFMKLTESGVLVVAGGGGFAGIKPGESQPHFVFKDYGKVKEEELTFIPMSPYVMIDEGAFGKSRKTVIDVVSGKKLLLLRNKAGASSIVQIYFYHKTNL